MILFIIKEFNYILVEIMNYYEVNNTDNITGNFMPLLHSYMKLPDAKFTQDKAHSLVSATEKKKLNEKGN